MDFVVWLSVFVVYPIVLHCITFLEQVKCCFISVHNATVYVFVCIYCIVDLKLYSVVSPLKTDGSTAIKRYHITVIRFENIILFPVFSLTRLILENILFSDRLIFSVKFILLENKMHCVSIHDSFTFMKKVKAHENGLHCCFAS